MNYLISTPIVFLIYLAIFVLLGLLIRNSASKAPGGPHELDPYACGQRDIEHFVSPNFKRVFSYAFFFTVMHVLVLVIATSPYDVQIMPIAYVFAGILAMIILFRNRASEDPEDAADRTEVHN